MDSNPMNSDTTSLTTEGRLKEEVMSAPEEEIPELMETESEEGHFDSSPQCHDRQTMEGRGEEQQDEVPMGVDVNTDQGGHGGAGVSTVDHSADVNATLMTPQPPGDEETASCQDDQGGDIPNSTKDFALLQGHQLDNWTSGAEQPGTEHGQKNEPEAETHAEERTEGYDSGETEEKHEDVNTGARDLNEPAGWSLTSTCIHEREDCRTEDASAENRGRAVVLGEAGLVKADGDEKFETALQITHSEAVEASMSTKLDPSGEVGNTGEKISEENEGGVLHEKEGPTSMDSRTEEMKTTVTRIDEKDHEAEMKLQESSGTPTRSQSSVTTHHPCSLLTQQPFGRKALLEEEPAGDSSIVAQAGSVVTSLTNHEFASVEGRDENVQRNTPHDAIKTRSDQMRETAVKVNEAEETLMQTRGQRTEEKDQAEPTFMIPGLSPQQEKEQHDETSLLGGGSKRKKHPHDSYEAEEEKRRILAAEPQTHYGLRNQGATCYLNSVLQLLVLTPELRPRLDSEREFDQELQKLFENLEHRVCETRNITRLLGIQSVFQQRDAAECLDDIFPRLSPRASELFRATWKNSTRCLRQHDITTEDLQCWSLTLPLIRDENGEYNVKESVRMFLKPKSLSADNKVFCPTCCEKTEATRECELLKFPVNLIVLLAKFEFNPDSWFYIKSQCDVLVPTALKMEDCDYTLCGMVDHTGGLRGGHYTTTAGSSQNQTWYQFNDSCVTEVSNPCESNESIRSKHAYLLKYRATSAPQSNSIPITVPKVDRSIQTSDEGLLKMMILPVVFIGLLLVFIFCGSSMCCKTCL
ncbi:uncharacterized protein LOC128755722 isoform X1 [Synchiropus splendidus]|uniref:uncharacterized protein LOC128755722 isoform X1 n=1 Tax=Synchiropus splendidus TaxID=270530 RepID=UPI00237DB68B|nr:uncharacterized protein LOC128755722 isoform X1 [Synchiropus splendidus]XP_053715637.1 uncharacterized protein LOC128755722 isoform X1 [Synchiropus splendidus]XP_053715638.1 uncharacterized protein LOC128755722 isoform X1 [Synchiropus splendidus]